ncbi:MAG: Fic family protein [Firmicutes bacterium]|nr:Fic family protein [Bacillota bacterium]
MSFDSIDVLKKKLATLPDLPKWEADRMSQEFITDFIYHSNAIEGNKLTRNETEIVLQGATVDKKQLQDHLEVIGHRDAINFALESIKSKKGTTELLIKKINELLLVDKPEHKGQYRKVEVEFPSSEYAPTAACRITEQMRELVNGYKNLDEDVHAIECIALFHILFEIIHPFFDGNGPTGRILMNAQLIKLDFPSIIIKFTDRREYFDCFEDYHKTKSPIAMISFIAKHVKEELERQIKLRKN